MRFTHCYLTESYTRELKHSPFVSYGPFTLTLMKREHYQFSYAQHPHTQENKRSYAL